MNNNETTQNGFAHLILLFVLVAVSVAGYFAYQNNLFNLSTKLDTQNMPTNTSEQNVSDSQSPDSAATNPEELFTYDTHPDKDAPGYTTYQSDWFEFKITFPDNWNYRSPAYWGSFRELENNNYEYWVLGFSPGVFEGDWAGGVSVYSTNFNQYLTDPVFSHTHNKTQEDLIDTYKEIVVNDQFGYEVLFDNGITAWFFENDKNGYLYHVWGFCPQEIREESEWKQTYCKEIDKIIPTFEFIDQSENNE